MEIEANKKKEKKFKEPIETYVPNFSGFLVTTIAWAVLCIPIMVYQAYLFKSEYDLRDYKKEILTECVIVNKKCRFYNNDSIAGNDCDHKLILTPVNLKADSLTVIKEVSGEVYNMYKVGKHIQLKIPNYQLEGKYFEYEEAKPSTAAHVLIALVWTALMFGWYFTFKFDEDMGDGFLEFRDGYRNTWLRCLDIFTVVYPIIMAILFIIYWCI